MKVFKIVFYFSAAIVALLFVMFMIELAKGGWKFKNFGKSDYELHGHGINDEFHSLEIVTTTADILVLPSGDQECHVSCYDKESMRHAVTVEDGTLKVKIADTRKWYNYIGFDFGHPQVTVYLPDAFFDAIAVSASTGDVEIKKISADDVSVVLSTGDVSLSEMAVSNITVTASTGDVNICESDVTDNIKAVVSTGDIDVLGVTGNSAISLKSTTGNTTLKNVNAASLSATASTGDAKFTSVSISGELCSKRDTGCTDIVDTTAGKFNLKASTGDVSFKRADADEIFVKVTTGDVEGTLLTDKVYITSTGTGKIDVPKTTTGGRCEITTTTGNIKISVPKD